MMESEELQPISPPKSGKGLGYPTASMPTDGYNHGRFWRGCTVRVIIMECGSHSGVQEEPSTRTNWKAAGTPGGGHSLEGADMKAFVGINLPEAWGILSEC